MGISTDTIPTILYVDDQSNQLTLFQKAFQGDYRILTADVPEKGLEILSQHNVFLVIADHNMPRMTGVDFLEKAKHLSPKSIQAIVSAYLNDQIMKEASLRTNVSEHLQKPWNQDMMKGFIEEAYRQYEIKIPDVSPSSTPLTPVIDLQKVVKLVHFLEQEWVDDRGMRRIFLAYSEPRLREYVAKVCRPFPDAVKMAQQKAIAGDLDGAEKYLKMFVEEMARYELQQKLEGHFASGIAASNSR